MFVSWAAAAAAGMESYGSVEWSSGLPVGLEEMCREDCGFPETLCSARDANGFMSAIMNASMAKVMNVAELHMAFAWSTVVWKSSDVVPVVFESFQRQRNFRSASAVHGTIWGAMRRRVDDWSGWETSDSDKIVSYVVDDLLNIRSNLTQSMPFVSVETVLHAIGHGALYVAESRRSPISNKTDTARLLCAQHLLSTDTKTARIAESICAALPSRELAYMCSSGLYHAVRFPKFDKKIVSDFGRASVLNLCEDVDFKELCLMFAFDDVVRRAEALRPGRQVAEFCPKDRWGPDLRSCYFGAAAVFACVYKYLWDIPPNFDRCRPETTTFDVETSAITAACVLGHMHKALITASDSTHPKDRLAHICQTSCATLLDDDNPNMKSAYGACISNFLCTPSNQTATYDSMVNVSLLEGSFLSSSTFTANSAF